MIGQTISHYTILEKLGEGGMGMVYKAEDTKLKRIVALKFLPKEWEAHEPERARFMQEAQAASALNHPNICAIHALGEHEEHQFIDMEYVEGRTLRTLLEEKELLLHKAIDMALQICEGLHAAHKKGIVHRDIKPDNIMVTDEGPVKIMDFGLAKLRGTSKLTKKHSTLGTIAYMSPEQARGEEVDQRSDIFSLGAVLYEMITGRRPFKGEHEAAMMYSLMNETPEPLARYKSNIPDGLQRVVEKALSKEQKERYQHVDEMMADLRRVQNTISGGMASKANKSKKLWIVVAAVVFLAAVGLYLFYPKSAPITPTRKSIAVLPFKNLSDSKEDEYFSDGLTEDIITQLSKISGIDKVIARTSVMRYKQTDKSIRDIGKELDVTTILEGSVRRAGNQVRVVAQLIDVKNEGHLWADTYDKEMTQVFAIQSDVAQQIAAALEAKMTPAVKKSIEKKQTENTEAYQLYLKGRFYWNKRTLPDLQKSIEYFNQALAKDHDYALAYAGLASSYVILPAFGLLIEEYYQKAEEAATKALEFDSTLAEAHTVLAQIKENHYDWTTAERIYRRAIELNPGYATARQWYSGLLNTLGRFDEALAEAGRAVELDPLSLIINYNLSRTLLYMRQYQQAVDQCNKGIELDPNFPWSYSVRGNIAEALGKYDEAIKDYQKARLLSHSSDPNTIGDIGAVYARTGRRDDAEKALRALDAYTRQGYSVSYYMAYVYYRLGDEDRTFALLEKSIHAHDTSVMDLSGNPIWDDLRPDPRFVALLKKVGLRK